MSFNNSVYKAYMDLATYGPMERMMYVREWFGDVGKSNSKTNYIFIILLLFILSFILLKRF